MLDLQRLDQIKGWFAAEEATLLYQTARSALVTSVSHPAIVEIGSYCGRSTYVLGTAVKDFCPKATVYAIDPHEGMIDPNEKGEFESTFPTFSANMQDVGLTDYIEPIVRRSYQVPWNRPIRLLFIDGFHYYENVSRDFYHFADHVDVDGYFVFHDYHPANECPGVIKFVDELIESRKYRRTNRAASLIVLQRNT